MYLLSFFIFAPVRHHMFSPPLHMDTNTIMTTIAHSLVHKLNSGHGTNTNTVWNRSGF